jgi:hypothetical protein
MANERLMRCAEGGMSIVVGSVDANGVATCCRGVAVATSDEFDTVTIYVPVATSQETLANVATTRRLALLCTNPLDHLSIQMKVGVLDAIGVPKHITRSSTHWPAFAIDMSVEEIFDQTPGPKAGNTFR